MNFLPNQPNFAFSKKIEDACMRLTKGVKKLGGRAFFVGGCVRNALMGLPSNDIDIEVFGLGKKNLETFLKKNFSVEFLGKSFGVYKLKDYPIDIALPRIETQTGNGHCDFNIQVNPELSIREAASRRDFTINAMLYDPLETELFDPFNGQKDLQNRILRHISKKFSEDALRVLRGMQFVSRFCLKTDSSTIDLCKTLSPKKLSKERIWGEWKKFLLKSKKPSLGLEFLKSVEWVQYYPELERLIGCEQDVIWHPEGDVWTHTALALDAFAQKRISIEREDLIVGTAILCHDFGKPSTSLKDTEGRIRSPGHEKAGIGPTQQFLSRMTDESAFIEEVSVLVANHLQPVCLYKNNASKAAIRRLAHKVKRIDRLLRVAEADQFGRAQEANDLSPTQWLKNEAKKLDIEKNAPTPILKGRHLIQLGLNPSPEFKKILKKAFQAQLDGIFSNETEGIRFLQSILEKKETF